MRTVYIASIRASLLMNLRNNVLKAYARTGLEYQNEVSSGGLQAMLTGELSQSVRWVVFPLEIINLVILNIVYLLLLIVLSWKMAICISVILCVAGYGVRHWTKLMKELGRRGVDVNVRVGKYLGERVRNWKFARLSGTEDEELEEFASLNRSVTKISVTSQVIAARTEAVVEPIVIFSCILFISLSITVFGVSLEGVGLFALISLRLTPVGKIVIEKIQAFNKVRGAVDSLEGRLSKMEVSEELDDGQEDLPSSIHLVKFRNVHYSHPKSQKEAIKSISCELRSNSLVGVVGASGSGKSTFTEMIPRFRNATHGEIFFDDKRIETYTLSSLRRQISYLPQDLQYFSCSIEEHISYGVPEYHKAAMERALILSGAKGFVDELPEGLNTQLGEDGVGLSGGQRQRIDLARALLRNCAILILDEPTNGLDTLNINEFAQTINTIRTETKLLIILITHELALVKKADKILVFSEGTIKEQGTYDELMTMGNWYSEAITQNKLD
jgi:subfamily B ATP-binding cassette protein MsbA